MSELIKRKERKEAAAIDFEYILCHLLTIKPTLPEGWMKMKYQRGSDDGLAEADVWRYTLNEGKITDVDVGFLRMIELLTEKVNELEIRIKKLESGTA